MHTIYGLESVSDEQCSGVCELCSFNSLPVAASIPWSLQHTCVHVGGTSSCRLAKAVAGWCDLVSGESNYGGSKHLL